MFLAFNSPQPNALVSKPITSSSTIGGIEVYIKMNSNKNANKQIIHNAQQLRGRNPMKYGVSGTNSKDKEYVKNGWKQAIDDSAAEYRKETGRPRSDKSEKRRNTPADVKKEYRKYIHELRELKREYSPLTSGYVKAPKKAPRPLGHRKQVEYSQRALDRFMSMDNDQEQLRGRDQLKRSRM
ncbi:hypothetical protein PPL_06616 [Heterostelium album PN500]|uniref:Uncharacterized protein n=1 Tax=Heterostelium pallidum (strain ATCC 26659 / Pp 5 / PN500) TaxID=670386 RepID=D3BF83_HETP5|nr:hypothetical protein PPL_06616 [Heterostelium album PN500]EFA79797.1 hypothetical protein PPL_06616 [Heterostelium album PN500]|eukprot:XP_020431918.1 hypothetical protein PPL_06616 [Heterostelium album PN500]